MSDASHVFIVGLPRTGSTLTRAMLNRSPEVRMSGESRFLSEPTRLGLIQRPGFADRFRRIGDIHTDSGLKRVVDHIYDLRGKGYWARLAGLVPRDRFAAALRASDRSDRAFLDVAMELFANGRRLRGEKTPHHIHHVPTLLAWYPEARVIHTFRDPRAVYVSMRRKERPEKLTGLGRAARRLGAPFDLYAMANLIHRWRWMARLHRDYAARYPDSYLLLRFEDLVRDPVATAERLAAFLGVAFDPAMLEQVVLNSSFAGGGRAAGIDVGTVDRWRGHLGRRELALFARFCGADLAEFGYRS